MQRLPHEVIRVLALLITFATGFSGLVYEVTWHRYLSNFIGSQAQAAAIILAVFLGGLCVGYAIFGRLTLNRTSKSLVSICGWIEVGIGIWAFLFPVVYAWIWKENGILDPSSPLATVIDITLCIALIGPPTILMGGTLPLLTQGLSKDLHDSAPFHAKVYAINTGGAFLGCLVGGFYLLPIHGLSQTMYFMAVLNIIAGAFLLGLAFFLSAESTMEQTTPSRDSASTQTEMLSLPTSLLVAMLAGLYSISLQTVFIRLVGLSMGASEYAFSMVVSVFVLMLALGAWRIGGREKTISLWQNQIIILVGIAVLYAIVPSWAYGSHAIRSLLTHNTINFYVYHAILFTLLAFLLALPVGAMGSTMPLLFGATRSQFNQLGTIVGKLYAINTLGCVVGAIVGGHLLLYFLNLDEIFLLCLGAVTLSLAVVFPWKNNVSRWARIPVSGLVLVGIFSPVLFSPWDKNRFAMGTFRFRETTPVSYEGSTPFYKEFIGDNTVLAYEDGPNTSVAVIGEATFEKTTPQIGTPPFRALYVNGKSDGHTSMPDLRTTRLLAHLPALLTTQTSKTAVVIGFGTGITPGALSLHQEIEQIDCIEISTAVRNMAPWFSFANQQVTKNPRFSWKVGDAYRVLGSSEQKYSIIVSEPSNPWVTGVERLYTKDFYEIVADSLEKKGIYAQWIHRYALSDKTLGLVYQSFSSVFPEVRTFSMGRDLILLGAKEPLNQDAVSVLHQKLKDPRLKQELEEIQINSPTELLAHEVWLPVALFRNASLHTLEFPKLAYAAGKDFFLGKTADVNKLLDNHYLKPWTKKKAEESLFFLSLQKKTDDEKLEVIQSAAKVHCEKTDLSFFKDWRKSPPACKAALTAMAANGEQLLDQQFFSEKELAQLAYLRGNVTLREDIVSNSSSEVTSLIRLFTTVDSPYLSLSTTNLYEAASPCFQQITPEAYWCQVRLIEALAWAGDPSLAGKVFERLKASGQKQLSKKVFRGLKRLIRESMSAQGMGEEKFLAG